MRYHINSCKEGIGPRAPAVLKSLPDVPLFHISYGLRHPSELYVQTFGEAVSHLSQLTDDVVSVDARGSYLPRSGDPWENRIENALARTLHAIYQHLEACKSLLCCFFEDCEKKDARNIVRSFSRSIHAYRDHVAKMVNYLKHRHARLRIVYFHDVGLFLPGYYVEGVVEDGMVGPDPDIHEGSNVAISFYRDIPFDVVNLYHVSCAVAQAVYEIIKARPTSSQEHVDRVGWSELVRKTSLLPLLFFPDEVMKPVPFVRFHKSQETGCVDVILELPATRAKASTVPGRCQIRTTCQVGEVTRAFKLPYFGEDKPRKKRR